MSRLPVVSGRDLVRALAKVGFQLDRQKGSHMILFRAQPRRVRPLTHRFVRGQWECGASRDVPFALNLRGARKGVHTGWFRRLIKPTAG